MRLNTTLVAAALAWSLPAAAQQWPDLSSPPSGLSGGERDAAVLVGIENYTYVADVPGAAQNAIDWYRYLTARGVPSHKIRLLVDQIRDNDGRIPSEDPQGTNDSILAAASQAAADVEPGGTLWFVFIGHGAPAQTGDDGLLVGVDASGTARGIYGRSVARSKVLQALGEGRQADTVVVLDTCFSGKNSSGAALVPDLQPVIPTALAVGSSATVLTATSSSQFAGPLPGAGRPAFSYLVLGALHGWGDTDRNGTVTAAEAVTYSRQALLTLLNDRVQEPQLEGGNGELVLGRAVAQGPDIDAIRLSMIGGGSRPTGPTGPTTPGLPTIGLDVDVTRMLAEQQCDRAAFDLAASQQRDALAEAQEADRTAIAEQWGTLQEQVTTCALLDDGAIRARCHVQVQTLAEALDGREVTVPARMISVDTDCGSRNAAGDEIVAPSTAAAATLLEVQALLARYDENHRLVDTAVSGPIPGSDQINVTGRARFSEELRAGFRGDPRTYDLTVGGSASSLVRTSALDLGPGCLGYVDPSGPSLAVDYRAGRSPLRIAACSAQDTTLLVHGPSGWICNDDGGPGTNPEVLLDAPESGMYRVFVGTINTDVTASASLYLSELRSRTFCDGAADPTPTTTPSTSGGSMRHDQAPRYGTLSLSAGFNNDPRSVQAQAGGAPGSSVEIRDLSLGDGCRGIVDPSRPDMTVDYTSGTYPLRFLACSSQDTALAVRGPNGTWYCDDDDGSGLNPDVSLDGPQSGQYDVWFGSVNGSNHQGTLYVTERRGFDPCEGASAASPSTPAVTSGGRPNVSADPLYGQTTLVAGFSPDPYRASVRAGGSTDVRTQNLDPSCRGYIAPGRPDYRIRYTAGSYALRIASCSGEDTTLIINDAAGNWHCSDDVEGRNPVVTWSSPPSGTYDVWIGKYTSGEAPAELRVSEAGGPYCD